ncbi:holo-ACP synthase [Lacticaseibacillus jixianensis]|uniref:Holo-[acyl-carrier-protein] synthase n=1 Tax=Lacticaseibacillus jixianensis TaxID=2486012 RepID=A0ABW4BC19_9LACO|nr:holo-ACP synthase [Lacticaseibacillus jixianensis]
MIYGIGVDLTELARIKQAQEKTPGFAEKVLTEAELAAYAQFSGKRAIEYLAGRFSVKESYAKAYGTGIGQVALHAIETLDDEAGKPVVTKHPFAGPALVSISHTDHLVMTQVILEEVDK